MSQIQNVESGSTGLARGLTVLQSQRLSRAGLVYGSSFSRGSILDAAVRRQLAESNDMWYDIERFQLDHLNEVLVKLNDRSLDDEIWGKIVVMERGKRIAKAYLRKTTIIVDGGDEEFDGKTLGFNYFSNPYRDEYTEELRSKIGDGVILKIDNQGNIKAMARGSTPVFVQGWRDAKSACIPDKVVRMHGKLTTKSPTCTNDDDRIFKVFDMRRFKQAVERDPYETDNDAKNLLLKTCVRLALVKDGGGNDPMKTPCWFMVINLVALDMLKTKLPSVCVSAVLTSVNSGMVEKNRLSRILSQTSLVPPSELYSNPALTQLLAAAVQQANSQYGTMSTSLSAASLPAALNVEQIAKLANSLSLATNNANVSAIAQALNPTGGKRPQRRQDYIKSSRAFSDSEDDISEAEPKSVSNQHTPRAYSGSTTGSSSGISGIGMRKERHKPRSAAKSMDVVSERKRSEEESAKSNKENNKGYSKSNRPRLSEAIFENPNPKNSNLNETSLPKTWKSCASTTSDYDSNREVFDSGSWSSQSRVSSANSQDEHRISSPSVLSETGNSNLLAKTANKQQNINVPSMNEAKQVEEKTHEQSAIPSNTGRANTLREHLHGREQPSELHQQREPRKQLDLVESTEHQQSALTSPTQQSSAPPTAVCLPMQRSQSPAQEIHQESITSNSRITEKPRAASNTDSPNKEVGKRGDQLSFGTRAPPSLENEAYQEHLSLQRNHRYRQNCRIQRGASGGLSIYEEPYARTNRAQSPTQYMDSPEDHQSTELSMRLRARRARQLQQEQEALLYHEQQQYRRKPSSTPSQECTTPLSSGTTTKTRGPHPTAESERDHGLYGRASVGSTDDSRNRVQQRIIVFEQKQLRDQKNVHSAEAVSIQGGTPTSVATSPTTTFTNGWDKPKMENHSINAGHASQPASQFGRHVAPNNESQQHREPLLSPKHDAPSPPPQPAARNSELAAQAAAAAIWRRRRHGPWDQFLARAQAGLPNYPTDQQSMESTYGYQPTWNRTENLPCNNTIEVEPPQYESRCQKPHFGTAYDATGATHLEIDDQGTIRRRAAAFFQQQQQQQPKAHARIPSSVPNTGSVRSLRDYYTELQARRQQSPPFQQPHETHHPQLSSSLMQTQNSSTCHFQGNQSYCTNNSPYQRSNGPKFAEVVGNARLHSSKIREHIYEAPPTPPIRHSSIPNRMTYS
uniref:MH2 domain-containing protein n=1 Tax=Acrobeloides nanus TaxID=290746 RepID=A0A914ED76_9BILA